MREFVAFLIFCAILVFIAVVVAKEHQAPLAMPLVKASAPSFCPRLGNPCDRVNCNKPNTKRIA